MRMKSKIEKKCPLCKREYKRYDIAIPGVFRGLYSVGFNTPTLGSALKKIQCVLYYRHERTCLQTS